MVLRLPKDSEIKEGKFLFPWIGPFQVKKAFHNNIVQLSTLNNEDITLVNVNKLEAYQNLIITIIAMTIITQDENKNLSNGIPRKITNERMEIYEHFKLNKWRGEAQHSKNYNDKIIIASPKKWIRNHKHQKNEMTIHYDIMIVKSISKT